MKMKVIEEIQDLARYIHDERNDAVVEGDEELATWLQDAHDKLVLVAHDLSETVTWDDVFDEDDVFPSEPEERDESPSERRAAIVGGLMAEEDFSADDVAERTGLGPSTVRNIIEARTTNPRSKTLRSLEQLFGLAEGDLDG